MAKKKIEDKDKKIRDLLFLAGLFIGLGLGLLYNQVAAGVLIGMGCGFLAAFIAAMIMKKK